MTEPDEATLWAREDWAKIRKAAGGPFQNTDAAEIRAGKKDVWGDVTVRAHAYRAGQAASAERIKALEEAIDAARLEGIRLGLEAAARDVWHTGWHSRPSLAETAEAIRLLDPATIAREAVLDKLASAAQAQGMGYEKEADQ